MLIRSACRQLARLTAPLAKSARGKHASRRRRAAHSRVPAMDRLEQRVVFSVNVLYDHADSLFDAELFADNLEASVSGTVVGWGYSISQDGSQGPAGGGGLAVAPVDLPEGIAGVPFDADTRIEVASVSKNITAAALLNALESHPFATVDSPIASYLPLGWSIGNDVWSISFRNLLTHTSGIGENYAVPANGAPNTEVGIAAAQQIGVDFNSFGNNTDANLQALVAYGVQNTYANSALDDIPQIGTYLYSNANYAMMRLLIPRLSGAVAPGETDPQAYADGYRDYVIDTILEPSGVTDAALADNALLRARVYRPLTSDPGISSPGADTGQDRTLTAGGFGWKLTPNELSAYLRHVMHEGSSPLQPETLEMMREELLGFTPGDSPSDANYGAYQGHNGSFSNRALGTTEAWRRRMQSAVMVFPNDVQAALIVNSNSIPAFSPSAALIDAYEDAWRRVAIGGTFGPDTFTVSASGGVLTLVVDEGSDGNLTPDETFTAPVSVLEQLTLVGYHGDDTFIVEQLPESVKLIIHAGRGSDTLDVAPGAVTGGSNLDAIGDRIDFSGGPAVEFPGDVDSINIYDNNNADNDTYYVTSSWFDRTGFPRINYDRIEQLKLRTGVGNDTLAIRSLPASISLDAGSGPGDDRVFVGGQNLSGNIRGLIDVSTGVGDDELILDDRLGTLPDDYYVFQSTHFQSSVVPLVRWGLLTAPEKIRLLGSNENSTTNVQGVLPDVHLIVQGRGGSDTINLHSTSETARATLSGGDGNDTLALTPADGNLDALQGLVVASGGGGAFDSVVVHDHNNTAGGRSYRFQGNWFDVIGSPFDRLVTSSTVETIEVQAGDGDDLFDVRSASTGATLALYGNDGSDTLEVAAGSQDLDSVNGQLYFAGGTGSGTDTATLNDQLDLGNDQYTLTTDPPSTIAKLGGFLMGHVGVEEVTLNANAFDNQIELGGAWALQPTHYTINAGDGADTITVNASVAMQVTVNGGLGSIDHARVRGTWQDDTGVASGDQLTLAATTVVFGSGLERRSFDAGLGHDLLVAESVAGVDDQFLVRATATAGSGSIAAASLPALAFDGLEDVEVNGNAADRDWLEFRGTDAADTFEVNPVAAGTALSPVVRLLDGMGNTLLNLRDFSNVGAPLIAGWRGADTFRVTVFPTQPVFAARDLRLDGGSQPLQRFGTRPQGDTLIVNYNPALFTQLPSSLGPAAGHIRLGHGTDVLDLVYSNFEELLGNLTLPF